MVPSSSYIPLPSFSFFLVFHLLFGYCVSEREVRRWRLGYVLCFAWLYHSLIPWAFYSHLGMIYSSLSFYLLHFCISCSDSGGMILHLFFASLYL